MNSAIYEGRLRHERRAPRRHAFGMRVALPLLDLDELDDVVARHRLWSNERPNVVSFRRADYLGDPAVPLDTAVRNLVEERTGARPTGPIRLLAHVRTWGWLFNPIAIYFCMAPTGTGVETMVLDVTNTPWHEHHAYVVDGGEGEHRFAKELHVSPFLGMAHDYRLVVDRRGERLVVRLAVLDGEVVVFEATLALRRRPIDRSSLGRLLWRYPMLTARVSAAIYAQAVRLRAKGLPVHPHPAR